MNLQSGQTYDGAGQAAQSGFVNLSGLKKVTVKNQKFNGAQFKLTDCDDVTFDSCDWVGSGGYENGRCLSLFGTHNRLVVTKNTFSNVACDSVLFCENGQIIDGRFDWNRFNNVTHGMHFSWGGAPRRNDCIIASNWFAGVKRFALEMQNGVQGLKIYRNYAANFQPNTSRMVFSIATGPSDNTSEATQQATYAHGVEVYDNFFGDPARQGNADAFLVCELMGADSQFHHNAGFGPYGAIVMYGWSRPQWKFFSNRFNCPSVAGFAPIKDEKMGVAPLAANVYDNDTNVPLAKLTAVVDTDVLNGRAWFQTTAGGTVSPAIVINTDPNAPAMTATARANTAGVIDITLRNTPAGTVQRRPTHGVGAAYAWTDVSPVVAGPCSLADTGQPANWEIDYQLVDAAGKVVVGTMAQVGPLPLPATSTTSTTPGTVTSPVVTVPAVTAGVNLAALVAAYEALGNEIAAVKAAMASQKS